MKLTDILQRLERTLAGQQAAAATPPPAGNPAPVPVASVNPCPPPKPPAASAATGPPLSSFESAYLAAKAAGPLALSRFMAANRLELKAYLREHQPRASR